jgi:type IV pilus assembly protein PilB
MLYGASHDTWGIIRVLPEYDETEFIQEDTADERQTISLQTLYKQSEAPPIVKVVTSIIADAVEAGASDIHIGPRDNLVRVRYRIDGNLKNIHTFSKRIRDSVISRIKIISNINITERRHPQDGRSALKIKDKTVDLRVSTVPSIHGEKIVIRLLDPKSGLIPLRQLGISNAILKPLIEIISQPQGMLLVTGPTGSGKTTTLYSILQQLENEIKNIITIEDPVEYKLKEITQIGVNESIGFTFAGALRSVLRQDPDIIMVGEIRDHETAEIAARSALTGHLVLSTLHTNDAVSAITRLLDIELESFLVNASVSGILAQRLVRNICPECKTKTDRPDIQGISNLPNLDTYYTGSGCSNCHHTGYRGRIGVYELLRMEAILRRIISGHFTEDDLFEGVNEVIPRTIFDDAWAKVKEGITTLEEVLSKVPYQSQRQDSAEDNVKKLIYTRNKEVSAPDRII